MKTDRRRKADDACHEPGSGGRLACRRGRASRRPEKLLETSCAYSARQDAGLYGRPEARRYDTSPVHGPNARPNLEVEVPPAVTGFTLIELLIVVTILGILAALLLPALGRSKIAARRVGCASNLHQLSLAAQMYWDDNNGASFRWELGPTNGGRLYWFGWLQNGAEGERAYDATQSALHPYLRGHSVGVCPSLDYSMAQFKLKATGAAYGYGYNLFLSSGANQPPIRISKIQRTSEIVLFADAAQVNDFQLPASKSNPMLEEWYYVDTTTNYPNGHFRHSETANTVFCDGHVGRERPAPGSLDPRLPSQLVGRLRTEILVP